MVCQLHVPDGDSSGKSGCPSVDSDQSEKLAELPALSTGGVLFVFLGWITSPVLSEIACSISILVFLGMVILGGRTARSELKRRFHI